MIKNAERSLNKSFTFKYPDWELTSRDAVRIDSVIQQLLNDNRITKDPIRERQWIQSQIITKLATAAFTEALQRGTKDWDATLADVFSLTLQAAMASRSGDFKRSSGWDADKCLKWQDLELVATGGHGNNEQLVFRMKVTLYNRKGFKWVPGPY